MLLEFYGLECSHCKRMAQLVDDMEKELKIKIEKFETWHNEENAKKMQEYDVGYCGGVPFFYNTDTDKHLCGEVDYEDLKAWAQGL